MHGAVDAGGVTVPPAPPPSSEPVPEPVDPEPAPPPAPADPLAGLPDCSGGVLAALAPAALQAPAAGSDGYRVPGGGRLVALEASIASLLAGDRPGALGYATSAEYELCHGAGSEAALALWRAAPGEGQARVVLRTGPARKVIFEAPHPFYDSGTLEQSRALFERLGARALIVSGTHRCGSNQVSGCSGTTATCGSSGPFRRSDMAHTEQSAFHAAHRALAEHHADHWVVGVHGMAAAGVSVSDGTNKAIAAQSPAAKVASALAARFAGVTSCNPGAGNGVPVEERLCGTTDVQGRHLNGVAQACTTAATKASGRFIHLEQSKAVRAAAHEVAAALDEVLP